MRVTGPGGRWTAWVVAAALVALWSASPARAQEAELVQRGPQFLIDASSSRARLDVTRTPVLRQRISIDLRGLTLDEALSAVSRESGIHLSYSSAIVPTKRRVELRADSITVAAVLTELLVDVNVDVLFQTNGRAVLIRRSTDEMVAALQTGTIVGRVTDSTSADAVEGARVVGEETRLSAISGSDGRYTLRNVPVGSRKVEVRRLGYRTRNMTVEVTDGGTATADFALTRAPTTLSDIVVTPTGDRQRLEVGNAIGTIKADSIVPVTLIRNMSDLLQARTPGVIVSNTSGLVGAPSKVRVRGVNSVRLNNDPIVIIDGVRLAAQGTVAPSQTNLGSVSNVQSRFNNFNATRVLLPSRLDDLDPTIIESIDILRGPSAASLYGTEAANGVIVIKTKKGTMGPWRFNVSGAVGRSNVPDDVIKPLTFAWGRRADGTPLGPTGTNGNLFSCWGLGSLGNTPQFATFTMPSVAEGTCVQDSVTTFNPVTDPLMGTLGTGSSRSLNLEMSGGGQHVVQFLSVRNSDNVGVAKMSEFERRRITRLGSAPPPRWMVRPNTERTSNASSRTSFAPRPDMDISVSLAGMYRDVVNGGAGLPHIGASLISGLSDTLRFLPSEGQRTRNESVAKRGIMSVSGTFRPLTKLLLRATVGGDYTLRADEQLARPRDCTPALGPLFCSTGHGKRLGELFVSTADVSAMFTFHPLSWLMATTAAGEQYTRTKFVSILAQNASQTDLAFGSDLLTPTPTPRSAGVQLFSVDEARDESATAGWYLEQTLGVRNRLYLTVGARQDMASAFGEATHASPPIYPKLNMSWVLSEESFFPRFSGVSQLRARAAYGHSGQQASQNSVLHSYVTANALATNGTTVGGIRMSQLGNPDLRPERTREFEAGFDLSFLEAERVRVEATAYNKVSKDAIMLLTLPGSFGIVDNLTQNVNVGSVRNRGIEVALMGRVIDHQRVAWDLTVNVSQNRNTLVKKDTAASASSASGNFLVRSQLKEGYPIYGTWGWRLRSYADRNEDGLLSLEEVAFGNDTVFFGAPYPRREITYMSSVSLMRGALRLNTSVNHVDGLGVWRRATGAGGTGTNGDKILADRNATLAQQAFAIEALVNGGYQTETSTVRLSELSVTYVLPSRLLSKVVRARSGMITVAARNVGLWSDYTGWDPNATTDVESLQEITISDGFALPQPRNWTVRVNLGF